MSLTIRRRNSGCAWLVVKFALTGFISVPRCPHQAILSGDRLCVVKVIKVGA